VTQLLTAVATDSYHWQALDRRMHRWQLQVLDTLSAWVDSIPPVTQSLRYGNPAFRTWWAQPLSQQCQHVGTL
jgi:Phosphotyrosyl phosphate activator (PTPA) protein